MSGQLRSMRRTHKCCRSGDRCFKFGYRKSRRDGLSLLEVILSIAILGGSLAMIGELIRIGTISASRAENLSRAQLIADTRMAELSSGALPLEAASQTPCEENPDWVYSVDFNDAQRIGLLQVDVLVEQNPSVYPRPLSIRISRWLADPAFIDEIYAAAEAEE